jgi:hypothetical protein
MAKASTGQAAPAKVKAAAPPAAARKKAKLTAAASTKKAAKAVPGKKSPAKLAAAPKMTAAPKKAAAKAAPPARPSAKGGKVVAPTKAAAKKSAPAKKAPVHKAATPRAATRAKTAAKTVAVKKAAPRRANARAAGPAPAARRLRPLATPRKAPAPAPALKLGSAPQIFTVSHLNEADFKADGLRAYAQYRDLGIAAATGGLCQAHVIRMVPPCTDDVRKRHLHHTELQLVYVLKGWMKNEFEGHGEQMMSTGSCWLQPSGIKHTVLDYSPDCEVLEIIVPADFKTEEVA